MEFVVQYESSSGNLVHKQKSCFIVGSSVPIARSQVTVFITGFQEKKKVAECIGCIVENGSINCWKDEWVGDQKLIDICDPPAELQDLEQIKISILQLLAPSWSYQSVYYDSFIN